MRSSPIAPPSWRLIFLLSVLPPASACTTAPIVVEKPRAVEVLVPVIQPIPAELSRDCAPQCAAGVECPYTDSTTLPIGEVIDRLEALEDALAICRNDKARIRALQVSEQP